MSRFSLLLVPPQVRRVARQRGVTKARVADEFHTFVEVKPAPGRWRVAAHITFCVTVTVLALSAFLGPKVGLMSLTGTFMCTVGIKRSWRHRVTILAGMIAAYAVCVTIGTLVAGNALATTLALTAISGLTVLMYNALVGDPPGPVFLTIGPAIGTYLPTVGVPGHVFVTGVVCGAVMSSTLSLLLQLPHRHDPEDEAVEQAEEACEEYFATDPDGDFVETGRLRDAAYGSIFNAAWALEASVGRKGRSGKWLDLMRTVRQLHVALVERTAATRLAGAPIAVPVMQEARYLGRPPRWYLLEWGIARSSLPALAARRAAASVFLTCVLAYALGVSHPYWAVMTTALLVSMNGDRLMLTHRAAHRFVGTALGVLIFFALSLLHLGSWATLAAALICVFLLQWTVVRNYALGSLFITPMALLVASAGKSSKSVEQLMGDRILETALSCLVCVCVLWVLGRRLPILLVRRQFRRALRALEAVLHLVAEGKQDTDTGVRARRNLVFEQLEAAHVLQIAQNELPRVLGSWEDVENVLNSASYITLAACWTEEPLRYLDAETMAAKLGRFIFTLPPVSTEVVDADAVTSGLDAVMIAGGVGRPGRTAPPSSVDSSP